MQRTKQPNWTFEEVEFLKENWRPFKSDKEKLKFVEELAGVSGIKRTFVAANGKARTLGLYQAPYFGLPRISEFAKEIEVCGKAMWKLVKNNPKKYPTIKCKAAVFLKEEAQEALREHYKLSLKSKIVVWGELTTKEAAKRLCISQDWLNDLILAGEIEAKKVGRYWRITEKAVREYANRRQQLTTKSF